MALIDTLGPACSSYKIGLQLLGIVASAHEASYLKCLLPAGTLIVTAGIQLAGATANDQARVATPEFARRAGATHVIIGRSITQAASPHEAFASALESMAAAEIRKELEDGHQ